eukprot:Protomagalhaensia_wolfi_Nauph_80__54@NODE_1032_length_1789_cov_249_009714_g215_i1_p1_GENE_NODE_1032_length_1789_cov_249_009714_g215_i1NODE_1032_length_1789_cov_249_009714_g215_i1_p1_ORF_typecomplete_len221_score22_71_NODE_1032_length_1789_cov_249_009714_g215_i19181580
MASFPVNKIWSINGHMLMKWIWIISFSTATAHHYPSWEATKVFSILQGQTPNPLYVKCITQRPNDDQCWTKQTANRQFSRTKQTANRQLSSASLGANENNFPPVSSAWVDRDLPQLYDTLTANQNWTLEGTQRRLVTFTKHTLLLPRSVCPYFASCGTCLLQPECDWCINNADPRERNCKRSCSKATETALLYCRDFAETSFSALGTFFVILLYCILYRE